MTKTRLLCSLFSLLLIAGTASAESITLYSARNEQLIKPLFDAYQQKTGVEIRFITDKEGPLMERLKAEGKNSPADLLLTVDAGNLWQAAHLGLLQPVESPVLQQNIPAALRSPDNQWFGLSVRARTLFYNAQQIKPEQLSTYEDLASPAWKGKLCLRTSRKVYNQSLVAMLIAEHGEAKTEQIVKGWVANLAAPVFADDTKMLEAIAAGQCQLGLANTYYYGRLMAKSPELPIGIFWPNQQNTGVHVNVSGAGLTRYAKNPKAAIAFLEWLSSTEAQNLFADVNLEYPVNPAVKPDARVAAWGEFKASSMNLAEAGKLQATAVKLLDRAGYK